MNLRTPKRLKSFQTVSHWRSPRQEKELAERLGGKRTPGSGNKDMKGDVRVKGITRIETKTTTKKSYSLTLLDVCKIETAGLSAGEVPAMVIEFLNDKGKPLHSLCVIPSWAIDLLLKNETGTESKDT